MKAEVTLFLSNIITRHPYEFAQNYFLAISKSYCQNKLQATVHLDWSHCPNVGQASTNRNLRLYPGVCFACIVTNLHLSVI